MSEQIMNLARFGLNPAALIKTLSNSICSRLQHLAQEPAFVSAILHENLDHPDEFLIYEIWHVGWEQFLRKK